MSSLVLDAGALIAVERHERSMWALLTEARERGTETIVPTSALAQAWRGGPRSAPISRLLEACTLDGLDVDRAQQVGLRLGAREMADVPDAHVVCCAVERGAAVATSDADDMRALAEPGERTTVISV